MAAPQAAPGAQVRGGRAWTRVARSSLTRWLPGARPPSPAEAPPPGARAASHLPGGRSAAPPPPSRSPDPSSARLGEGCRATGIIAIAAASAHPGSRGEPGARRRRHGAAEGAAPSAGHSGPAPSLRCAPSPPRAPPRAPGGCAAARPPSSARARRAPGSRIGRSGSPAPWGSLGLPGRRASGLGNEEEKGGGTDGTQRPTRGLTSQGGTPWNGRGGGPTLPRRRVCGPPWRLARPAAHRPTLRVREGARLAPLPAAAHTVSPRLTGGGVVQFGT